MGPPVKLVWGLAIGGLRFGFRSPISLGEIDERPCATRLARGIDDGPECCLVAVELSKKSRLPGSRTALPGMAPGHPVEIIPCCEVGCDGFWLHRLLRAHGVVSHVFDAAGLQVGRRTRRPGPDRTDVRVLVRAPMAHLRGEPGAVSVVQVPDPEREDARRLHRERARPVNGRIRHVNRIKGSSCGSRGCAARRGASRVEAECDAVASGQVRDHPHADRIVRLTAFKGIGALFATALTGEVYRRDFASRRRLGSCPGLAGRPWGAADRAATGGVSRA